MKIYTVTAIDEIKMPPCNSRVFGWFTELEEAQEAVNENRYDLHECLYDFIVIEQISEGIHCCASKEWWYKWDREIRQFNPIEKPKETKFIVNWGIG